MNSNNQKIKTRTLEEYTQVMRVRKQKKAQDVIKISRITGIPKDTIRGWIYRGVKPKRLRKTKFLPKESKKLGPELAYILGVIQGDGCLCKSKRHSLRGECFDYILVLGVTDKDFADYFSKQLEKWSSFKTYKYKYPQRGKGTKDIYGIRLRSKDVFEFLSNFDLDILLESDEQIKSMFLKGLFDSEGSVSKTKKSRTIRIGMCNIKIIKLAKNLIESLGIKCGKIHVRKVLDYKPLYLFCISSKESLKRYRDCIGFSIKRKQERLDNLISVLAT